MTSNLLANQAELALARPPAKVEIPLEMIWAQKNQGAAFTLACSASGLEDKEIASALEIDAGTFSRLKSGTNTLHADKLQAFCSTVGNIVYPIWMAYQVGCGLHMLKTEAERLLQSETERANKAEEKLAWAMEILVGGR